MEPQPGNDLDNNEDCWLWPYDIDFNTESPECVCMPVWCPVLMAMESLLVTRLDEGGWITVWIFSKRLRNLPSCKATSL